MTFICQSRRAVTQIVELVGRSEDDAPFISEFFSALDAFGITPMRSAGGFVKPFHIL